MAKTSAERQAEYRQRAEENGDQRFSTFLPPESRFALEALAEYHGVLKTSHKNLFGKTQEKAYQESLDVMAR
jgi:hypothetical protein